MDIECQILNVQEASIILGVSTDAVYKACKKGDLPHTKIGGKIIFTKVGLERKLAEAS